MRTLKIMADVYSKGLVKEMQLEAKTVEQVFPVLDDLLDLHTSFFSHMLERRREAQQEGKDGSFVIRRMGDVLATQVSAVGGRGSGVGEGSVCWGGKTDLGP